MNTILRNEIGKVINNRRAIAMASILMASNAVGETYEYLDHFDGGILEDRYTIEYVDNGSGANELLFDESVTLPSHLTVTDVLSPLEFTDRWNTAHLVLDTPAINDFQVEAKFDWATEAPSNYPGSDLEGTQALMVQLFDSDGVRIAEFGYRDQWPVTGERWASTMAGDEGAHPGELPLAGSATYSLIRTGDQYEFVWNGSPFFSIQSSDVAVEEIRLEFRTFVPGEDRFVPRSFMGELNLDYIQISGELENLVPVADAGSDVVEVFGAPVVLDGSGSYDDDVQPLTYNWSVISAPDGSLPVLDDPSSVTPLFTALQPGAYEISLTVDDGTTSSDPDSVTVTYISGIMQAELFLLDAANLVAEIPACDFDRPRHRDSMLNRIGRIIQNIQDGRFTRAINKLDKLILRVDGCSLNGEPDTDEVDSDWITNCAFQEQVYSLLQNAKSTIDNL